MPVCVVCCVMTEAISRSVLQVRDRMLSACQGDANVKADNRSAVLDNAVAVLVINELFRSFASASASADPSSSSTSSSSAQQQQQQQQKQSTGSGCTPYSINPQQLMISKYRNIDIDAVRRATDQLVRSNILSYEYASAV